MKHYYPGKQRMKQSIGLRIRRKVGYAVFACGIPFVFIGACIAWLGDYISFGWPGMRP